MPDMLTNSYFRTRDFLKVHENFTVILLAALTGILGGYIAIGFRFLIHFIQTLCVGNDISLISAVSALPWYYKLLLPAMGGLIVGPIVTFYAREVRGAGVPEVMEAVALHGGRIRTRVIALKTLASAITLGTGGSAGREGPIVQIGSAAGSFIARKLKCPVQRTKTLVACGAAAGIAATFNAPITGVLFSVEIILGSFSIHTFSPLVVSSVLATVISHTHLGNTPAFIVPEYFLRSPLELVLYLILGFLIAWLGLLFIHSIGTAEQLISRIPVPEYLRTAVGLLGVGAIICFFPHCFGNGYESISLIFQDHFHIVFLLLLLVAKIVATSITLGAGGSGGIFAPSLFIGAVAGGTFGRVCSTLFPYTCASSGAYAMVGMGALVGALTHAPFTAIITMFELTGDYKIILPMMFCTIFASLIIVSNKKDSIYTAKLTRRGIRLNMGLESSIMKRNTVEEVMHIDVRTVDPDTSFEALYNMLINSHQMHHYVVGADHMFLGEIAVNDLPKIMATDGIHSNRKALDIMHTNFPFALPDATLLECIRTFALAGVQELPVVDPVTHHFLGVIDYRDVFKLYNREVLREGTLGIRFVTRSEEKPRNDYVNIPDGFVVELIPVVGNIAGRSILELDLRHNYNITIVAIKTEGATERCSEIPCAERVLTRQDALIVVGSKGDIQRLRDDL